MDPVTLALQIAFFVLFGVSVYQYLRNRGPLELSVVAIFGSIAALFTLSIINTLTPAAAPVARPVLLALLMAQPYLVLRLIAQMRPVRPGVMRIALLGFVAAWAAVVLLPPAAASLGLDVLRQAGTLFAVGYFFTIELGAAAWFALESRRRYGVARMRLAAAAIATGMFGASLLLSGIAGAARPAGAPAAADVQSVTRFVFLLATIALVQYVEATGDWDYLSRGAVDILVETARMWQDLGFWRSNGDSSFHIYGVTGPDEYTTVVNDNLFTNVMARANLRAAARICRRLEDSDPDAFARMRRRVGLQDEEIAEWSRAAEAMHVPYDAQLGIHPQDAQFLEKEVWDLDNTPATHRPLLLHYHPLVIYRFQVLKQADVVLALLLQGDEFTLEEKLKDFEYYDPLTTGDSTLSAVVQSIIAAEVGYAKLAFEYFLSALYVDLADLHRNTPDGIHVASTGGVWSALVYGFGGLRDWRGRHTFDPRLPEGWERLEFRFAVHGSRIRAELRRETMTFTVEEGAGADLWVRGEPVAVRAGEPAVVALDGQGPRLTGVPSTSDLEGSRREDGSLIVASVPTIATEFQEDGEEAPALGP